MGSVRKKVYEEIRALFGRERHPFCGTAKSRCVCGWKRCRTLAIEERNAVTAAATGQRWKKRQDAGLPRRSEDDR